MPDMHYVCWFTHGSREPERGFVPADGSCLPELDQVTWEMSEVLRNTRGINLAAFVPVLHGIGEVDLATLPPPSRCLEVLSEDVVQEARTTEHYPVKNLFNAVVQISGSAFADWLEGYRKRWAEGFYVVRVPNS